MSSVPEATPAPVPAPATLPSVSIATTAPTTDGTPPRDVAVLAAANKVFQFAIQLGAAAVVVTALCYYLGDNFLQAKFKTIGASWYVKTLPFERVAAAGIPLASIFAYAVCVSILLLATGLKKRLVRIVGTAALLGAGACAIAALFASGELSQGFRSTASALFLVGAGTTVGEIVDNVRERGTFDSVSAYAVWAGTLWGLFSAPSLAGVSHGLAEAGSNFAFAPVVEFDPTSKDEWRLISAGGEFGLVVTAQAPRREFRLIKLEQTVRVFENESEERLATTAKVARPASAAALSASAVSSAASMVGPSASAVAARPASVSP